jgi:predicted metal-dependent peptidase
MIRDVVENKCKVSGWGRLSGDQVEEIMLKNKRKVNIVPIIAGFGASVRCRKRVSTRLRVNKRYDYLPGYRTDRKTKMLFAIDSSGSMSQSDIEKGCAILHNFYKKTEIDLAFWDAQMVEPKKLTRNIQKIEAPGRGGTDPACIGEWLKAHNKHYDGVVIFTDCYWEWNENNLGQHIFVISSEKEYSVPDFVKHHASIQELTHVFDD